jgi:hypothetical protein
MAKFKVGDKVKFYGRPATIKQVIHEKDADYILDVQGDEFYAEDEEVTCRNSVVVKALNAARVARNACGTARNANFSPQDITKQLKDLSLKMTGVRMDYNKVKASDRLIKKSLSALGKTIYDNADKITAGDKNAWDPMFREIYNNSPFGPM